MSYFEVFDADVCKKLGALSLCETARNRLALKSYET